MKLGENSLDSEEYQLSNKKNSELNPLNTGQLLYKGMDKFSDMQNSAPSLKSKLKRHRI